jgi:hypothetical protein
MTPGTVQQFNWPGHLMVNTADGLALRGVAVGRIIDGHPMIMIAADSAGLDAFQRTLGVRFDNSHVRHATITVHPKS